MRHPLGWTIGVAIAFAVGPHGLVACSSTQADAPVTNETDADLDASISSDGGGNGTPDDDASIVDAGRDAALPCSADGFCTTALPVPPVDPQSGEPPDPTVDVRAVWVARDHRAFAVTAAGHVLRWDGTAWQDVFDAKTALRTVWGTTATDVWVGGDGGAVFHGIEKSGTLTFDRVELGSTESVRKLWGNATANAAGSIDVWAVTESSIRRFKSSAASSFVQIPFAIGFPPPYSTVRFASVWGDGSQIWVGGQESCDGDCTVYYQNVFARWRGDDGASEEPDGGVNPWERAVIEDWTLYAPQSATMTSDGIHFLFMPGANNSRWMLRLASSAAGQLDAGMPTTEGPFVWTKEAASTSGAAPEATWANTSSDVWVVASPGVVRHWNGSTWEVVRVALGSFPLTNDLHGVHGVVDSAGKHDLWVVGKNIAMHRSEQP